MGRSRPKLPRLAPVKRGTVHERIYEQLCVALMRGRFVPGHPVSLRSLAEAFGTSATPVREALRRLVAEQALVVLPNRTVIVPLLTAERLDELRHIRVALEGMTAKAAADLISPAELEKLKILNAEMIAAAANEDVRRYLLRNQQFHFTIYRAAPLPAALRLIENMWLQIGPVLNFLLSKQARKSGIGLYASDPRSFGKHHQAAIRALAARDGSAASQAIAADITEAADFLLSSSYFQSDCASKDGLVDAHQTRLSLQPPSADVAWIKPR